MSFQGPHPIGSRIPSPALKTQQGDMKKIWEERDFKMKLQPHIQTPEENKNI